MRVELASGVAVAADVDGLPRVEGAALGGRRAHLLIGALCLEPSPISPERLAELLWDRPPPTWRVAVRGLVADLRKRVGEIGPIVDTVPSGYRLSAGVTTDIQEWESAVVAAAGARASGDWRRVTEVLGRRLPDRSVVLLGGTDAAWLTTHRDRLEETLVQATLLLAEAQSQLGEHDSALAVAGRLVRAHPLDERAHRQLIEVRARAGDRAGAVLAFEECRQVLASELAIDPSRETVEAYLSVLGAPTSTGGRLPERQSEFFGREGELGRIAEHCAQPGVVTLVGVGGVGKSRLALEVATRMVALPGRRHWVSLSALVVDALVDVTVGQQLGVDVSTDPGAEIVALLSPLGRSLLVVDGCEAVRDGLATLLTGLVAQAPELTVLVTSRVPLDVVGEQVIQVDPLAMPGGESVPELSANAQIRLLVDRARSGGGAVEVDEAMAPYLAALCRRCGGLPLALELAAAQLSSMSAADLVDHVDEVTGVTADALRDIAGATHALLDPDEAAVFRRLAVLEGPVDLGAVRAVVEGADVPHVRVVRILRELGARGLLIIHRDGPRWTYELDDDLHRFADEQLVAADEESDALIRLGDLVRSLLPDDPRSPPAPFADAVTALLGSVRALLAAGVSGRVDRDRALEIAFRLHRYWAATNVNEGRYWLGELLAECDGDGEWTGYAEYALGYLHYWAGAADSAVAPLESAIALLATRDGAYVARAQIFLAGIMDDLDDGPRAVTLVREAIGNAAPYGRDLQVSAAMGLGSVLAERGDVSASAYAADAIALCHQGGSAEQLAASLATAAMVAWQVGDLDRCRAWVDQAMPMHAGSRRIARVVLHSAACGLEIGSRDLAAAVRLGQIADAEGTELGVERELPLARSLLAIALLASGDPEAAHTRAQAAVAAAQQLDYRFPLALALEAAAATALARGVEPPAMRDVLAVAASIRRRGDRPVPVVLAPLLQTAPGVRGPLSQDLIDAAVGRALSW